MTFPRRTWLLPAILLAALGCSNAGEDFGFGGGSNGAVGVFVFLDRDGSGDATTADTVLAGVKVGLVAPGTTDTLFGKVTDGSGNAIFNGLPLGDYTLVVDTNTVGDSVSVQSIDSTHVVLRNNAAQLQMFVRVGFPSATVTEARALPAGTRVFVKGLMLTNLNGFGDSTAHVTDAGAAMRLSNATSAGPQPSPGDSVRVLGTVATRAGQPVLDSARVTAFQAGPAPTAITQTTQQANTAQGGAHDAALVLLTNAVIQTDTATVNGDYTFSVDDGSGPLKVVLDQDVLFPLGQFTPGKTLNGRGVLVPTGTGTWVFKPRANNDVQLS